VQNLLLVILILVVSSCSKDSVDYSYPVDPENKRNTRAGKFFDGDVVLYGQKKSNIVDTISQNKLFQSADNIISDIADIDISDSDLGIISSKWKESKDGAQKTKITVLIKSEEIKKESLDISIHKKHLNIDGQWQKKKSENEELLIELLKEKILAAAR
jgi:uncharacterized protein YhdP